MSRRLVFLIVLGVVPSMASAQALADRVPGDAIVYIGWQGAADLGPGYAQSNLKAVLDESNLPAFLEDFLPRVMAKLGQNEPQAAEFTDLLGTIAKPSWQHPTAFFFAGVEKGENAPPMPHLGVIWEPGAEGKALSDRLNVLIKKTPLPLPVKVVRSGELVALMVGYKDPEAALAASKGAKSLLANAAFKEALGHVQIKAPLGTVYVNYEKILGLAEQMIAEQPDAAGKFTGVRDALGLKGLKRLIAVSGFDGKDWGSEAFLEAPEPRTGLLKLIGGKPLSEGVLSAIPRNSVVAGAGRFDVSEFLDVIHNAVAAADSDAAAEMDNFFNDLARRSGVDMQRDLLASLGDEWAYFHDPLLGGEGMAGLTVINHLKDPAKFEKAMSKVQDFALAQLSEADPDMKSVQIRFRTTEVEGMKVHYLAVPLVSPSWIVKDGVLYAALFPQVAASAASHTAQKGASILQNPGFLAVQKRLGVEQPVSFSFMDLPKTAPQAYSSWLFVMQLSGFGDIFGIKSPPMILPRLEKLMARLAPAGEFTSMDAAGIHMRSVDPFPGSKLLASDPAVTALYAEPVMISILLPALNRAREAASRIKTAANLSTIGKGAILYANDHKGRFPDSLGKMLLEEDLSGAVFINPRTATALPQLDDKKALADWVNQNSDYIWLGKGKNDTLAADAILAYEKPDLVTEGINILYGDGHVEWVQMGEAQRQIKNAVKPDAPRNGDL